MLAIIALNVVFAALVVGGVVALLARSIWTSRIETSTQAGRSHASRPVTRRQLATVAG
jgi:hypothetical protein